MNNPRDTISDRDRYYKEELEFLLRVVRQHLSQGESIQPDTTPLIAVERLRDLVDIHRLNHDVFRTLHTPVPPMPAPPMPPQPQIQQVPTGGGGDDNPPEKENKAMAILTPETGIKMTLGAVLAVIVGGVGVANKYIEDTKKEAVRQAEIANAIDRQNKVLEDIIVSNKKQEQQISGLREELIAYQDEAARLSVAQSRLEKDQKAIQDAMYRRSGERK